MSVSNGQIANAQTWNDAFLSKQNGGSTEGVITLSENSSGGEIANAQQSINDLLLDVADIVTLTGLPANSTDLGLFSGSTIAANVKIKAALQSLETKAETNDTNIISIQDDVANLVTLTGVGVDSTSLGAFSGSTFSDDTIKNVLQEAEIAIEANATNISTNASNITANDDDIANLVTLTGVAADSTTLGAFSGSTFSDDTIKAVLQEAETAIEANAAALPETATEQSIANNTVNASLTGVDFDDTLENGARIHVVVRRRDDTEERMAAGYLTAFYYNDALSWDITEELTGDANIGVTFSITAAGQVQITTDNMAGANYYGRIEHQIIDRFPVFTS